jgi:hypothetical protein
MVGDLTADGAHRSVCRLTTKKSANSDLRIIEMRRWVSQADAVGEIIRN